MTTLYRFGRFELSPATRQLLADGGQVTLGVRAFDVLVVLVERRERMVTKDELRVVSRTIVMECRDSKKNMRQIGSEKTASNVVRLVIERKPGGSLLRALRGRTLRTRAG